jgi:myo-inositol-1(or 4)-monophosphatase
MKINKFDYLEEFEFSKKLILEVGSFLISQENKIIESSIEKDIKLELDKIAEEKIVSALSKFGYSILSEELGLITKENTNLIWIIDPIDGTLNYSRNNPSSCISIALYENEIPIFGIIYDFNRDELFSGYIGMGIYINEQKIVLDNTNDNDISNSILATGFPSYISHDTTTLNDFINKVQKYKKIRMIGSAALSLSYVAIDRFDTYMENSIKLWDVAAGIAINKAIGKRVEVEVLDDYLLNVKVGVY